MLLFSTDSSSICRPTTARYAKARERSYDEAGMTVWTAAANTMGTAETTGTP